ncbi:hypothetical protein [Streptomyces sp. NPDC098781]|uniref:hypothetical protein n=1 Tax=Streptomyces sp. NPDC098781 TaxID=3366097 RepID=UPI0038279F68
MTGGAAGPRAALAAVPIALALLAGCGPGNTADAGGPPAAAGAPSTTPASGTRTPATPTPAPPTAPPTPTPPASVRAAAPTVTGPATPTGPATGPSAGRVRGPDLSRRPAPSAEGGRAPTTLAPTTRAPKANTARKQSARPTRTTIRIGTWSAPVVRGGQAEVDACREAVQWTGPELGTEDGYEMSTAVIVGHDYCGFDRFATLPIGSTVTISGPRGTWRYQVYAHYITPGRGAPAAGLYWGDLTLQSCVGPDTGFSYLTRI